MGRGGGEEERKVKRQGGKKERKKKGKGKRDGKEKNNIMLLGNESRSERMSGISHKPTKLTLPISNISLQMSSFIVSL